MNPHRTTKLNKYISDDFFKINYELIANSLTTYQERIFNTEERGFRLSLHTDLTIYAEKGLKRVYLVAKERGESVTFVACGSATGAITPPMILYNVKESDQSV